MKKIMSFMLALAMALAFAGCGQQTEVAIGITIPAHTENFDYIEDFIYSDEEISTKRNSLTLSLSSVNDDFGNAEIVLKPVEYEEENAYERMPVIPGTPARIDGEKGAWFKIGVAVNNEADEDMTMYVNAEKVDVRIGRKG